MTTTLDDLAHKVRTLCDRAAISDALIAFARAVDTKDWPGYADLYTEDGVLELPFLNPDGTPGGHVGRAGLAQFVEAGLGGFKATHHLSGNHQITIDGETATTVSYCQCVHRHDEDHSRVWELGGWYLCELRRSSEGTWQFSKVHLEMVWQTGSPTGE